DRLVRSAVEDLIVRVPRDNLQAKATRIVRLGTPHPRQLWHTPQASPHRLGQSLQASGVEARVTSSGIQPHLDVADRIARGVPYDTLDRSRGKERHLEPVFVRSQALAAVSSV